MIIGILLVFPLLFNKYNKALKVIWSLDTYPTFSCAEISSMVRSSSILVLSMVGGVDWIGGALPEMVGGGPQDEGGGGRGIPEPTL